MCGIFGVMAGRNAPYDAAFLRRSLRTLARYSQSRGRDSSGLAVRDPAQGRLTVFKGALTIGALFKAEEVKRQLDAKLSRWTAGAGQPFAVFGHSRLVTNGSQLTVENNQPAVTDGVVGIHNGIIVNDAAIWQAHPELTRHHDIDTEVFLALVRASLRAGYDAGPAVSRAVAEAEGTLSTALLFADRDELVLSTNNGSLYLLTNHRDLLFFASERHPLEVLRRLLSLEQAEFIVEQVVSGTGLVLRLHDFTMHPFSFVAAAREPVALTRRSPEPPLALTVTPIGDHAGQLELVSDVAVIARAPEAARNAALLEYHADRVASLRRCSKCILPETFPFIDFDDAGVCNYCRNYRIKNQPKPREELLALLEPYRRRDSRPDCIVPFSGGRDSTYALHVIKKELGLNPIAFTYDWGMVTDLGRRNIARVCGKLGVENIIVAADIHWKRRNIHKNIVAWLRRPHLGMIPLFMAGDKYFYYYVDQVKRQTGVSLNLWGVNPMENTDFKVGFLGVGPDFAKRRIYSLSLGRQLRLFRGVAGAVLSNPGYINGSVFDTMGSFVSRSVMPHRDYFHLYDYFQWNEHEIDRLLFDEYDWERAIDTDTTWRIGDGTAAFYNYIYFTVAGFSEHDTFRSNQIREGMMGRDEALRRVAVENRPRYATIKWYTDMVMIDYERAIKTISRIPKLYP